MDITLDDSMTTITALKLSNFKNVLVNTRISKSEATSSGGGDMETKSVEAVSG